MQRGVKNKIGYFSFGLLAGITIGVVFGVTIKSLLGHLNQLDTGIVKIGSKEDRISQRLDSIEGKIKQNSPKAPAVAAPAGNVVRKTVQQPVAANTTPTLPVKNKAKKIVDREDTIAFADNTYDSSDVVVMTNQMINSISLELVNLDTDRDGKSKIAETTDSAIDALNGMTPVKPPSSYLVEYWASPLNFKGYKMSLGKIILYGMNPNVRLKLVKLNNNYYLFAGRVAYMVNYTDDLRPFDKVTDKNILKKLSL